MAEFSLPEPHYLEINNYDIKLHSYEIVSLVFKVWKEAVKFLFR